MSPGSWLEVICGALLAMVTLWDAFETIVLPRTIERRLYLTRAFFRLTWSLVAGLRRLLGKSGQALLVLYGPLFLIGLIGLWALGLIFAFGVMLDGVSRGHASDPAFVHNFSTALYLSGSSFFTLGLGDVSPGVRAARALVVLESGVGFGFLAMVIGYLPIFYQAFSRREVSINLLDARAGSPPTAIELIRRNREAVAGEMLAGWERWISDVLESHLSYPILALFRSQHENQSWLSALTAILDTCAVLIVGAGNLSAGQARFTFAIARHTLVDLAQVFQVEPAPPDKPRLNSQSFEELCLRLEAIGFGFREPRAAEAALATLRSEYEAIAHALGRRLALDLPPWLPGEGSLDDWQTSPWDTLPPL